MSVSFKVGFKGGPKKVYKSAACFASMAIRLDELRRDERKKTKVELGTPLYFSLLLRSDKNWMEKPEEDRVFLCELWFNTFGALLKPEEVKSIRVLKNGEISYITYDCTKITWWKLVTISSFFRMATENSGWIAVCRMLSQFDIHPWVVFWMAMNLRLGSTIADWIRDPHTKGAEVSDNCGHSPIESDRLTNLSNLRRFIDGSIADKWDSRRSMSWEYWHDVVENNFEFRNRSLSCYGRDNFLLPSGSTNWIQNEAKKHRVKTFGSGTYNRERVSIPDFIKKVINKYPEFSPAPTQEKV